MISNIFDNVTNFLRRLAPPAPDPMHGRTADERALLVAARKLDLVARDQVTSATGLSPETAAEAINNMRAANMVEVVTFKNNRPRFLQSTAYGREVLGGHVAPLVHT